MISTAPPHDNPARKPESPFSIPGVLAVSLGHFIHDVYSAFLAPLLPLLIEKLTLNLTQAGLLTTVMQLPALANPWIGTLADRVSVRWFLAAAPAMTAVAMSLIGCAPTYGVLVLLMLLAGISVSLFHVPAPVMIARMAGSRRGLGMSLYMVGGEAARAVGPIAAVAAASLLGLEGMYPVMLVGLLCSLLLWVRVKDLPDPRQRTVPASMLQTWRKMHAILRPISGILLARGCMHGCMASFLPTFVASTTGNLWLAGSALTVYEIAGVLGVMAAGTLSDSLGRRRMLAFSMVGAPVSLLLFVWVPGWPGYLFLFCTGCTLLSTTPVMLALVQDHAGDSPAAANGLFMMISFLTRSAVVVVIGLVADLLGLRAAFSVFAVLGLTGVFFIRGLPADGNRRKVGKPA